MSANVSAMVKEAIRAYRAGKVDEAQALLMRATELDDQNEHAWMWLSAVVESVEDKMVCMENVLIINPNNVDAQRGLELLKAQQARQQASGAGDNTSPFSGLDPDEWGDIDTAEADFLSDLRSEMNASAETQAAPVFSAPEVEPADDDDAAFAVDFQSDYQSGFEDVFEEAVFDTDFDDDFDDMDDPFGASAIETDDEPVAAAPVEETPRRRSPPPPVEDDVDLTAGDLFVSDSVPSSRSKAAEGDAATAFASIPAEIKPTRVPGTDERYSPVTLAALVGLAAANIAAVVLLLTA
ncbi:MAG: tetratricopeptide repeat protein [Chloroflexota bacterium]